ncbi:MAG: hypothetical protein JXA28_03120 [Bacteroidetes bacterium]|nr:hypothetical protein [Bacteroidota bacterium]
MRISFLALLLGYLIPATVLFAQIVPEEDDPCGFALGKSSDAVVWDYFLDDLSSDMQRWSAHPWVQTDVIGLSVQQRPLYHIAVTNPSSTVEKRRMWIHARTHPIESESSSVAREIMDELLSGSPLARRILDNCIVHLLPMLNPDGVELRRARENANGVDLESNWGVAEPQPEVQALRRKLEQLMRTAEPIDLALNLHSAFTCKRYFVFHAAAGTSVLFTQLQQRFIGDVRGHFPGGIEPWDFFVSWTSGTPDRYPESWFWLNHAERVMALTYEDMNCAEAGEFDRTARALLAGTADYLGIGEPVSVRERPGVASSLRIDTPFPHPVRQGSVSRLHIHTGESLPAALLTMHDLMGREVLRLWEGPLQTGTTQLLLRHPGLTPGVYLLRLRGANALIIQRAVTVL